MPSGPALRAADDDRRRVAALLGEHLAAGRLTLAEYEERVAAAFAAVTLGDLQLLLRDLPELTGSAAPGDSPHLFATGKWLSWAVTAVISLVIWAAASVVAGRPGNFWPIWVIGPWGAVLLARSTRCVPGHWS